MLVVFGTLHNTLILIVNRSLAGPFERSLLIDRMDKGNQFWCTKIACRKCIHYNHHPIFFNIQLNVSEDSQRLQILLQQAVMSARNTLVLGSSNNDDDVFRTQSYVNFALDRVYSHQKDSDGNYLVTTYMKKNKSWNKKNNKKWEACYVTDERSILLDASEREDEANKTVSSNRGNYYSELVVGYYGRAGNCATHSKLVIDYLWAWQDKNPEEQLIHTIELVSLDDIDHAVVLVNRTQKSAIKEPNTWNCFVVDAWRGAKNISHVYHSSCFNVAMKKIANNLFLKIHSINTHKFGVTVFETINPSNEPYTDEWKQLELFPSVINPHLNISKVESIQSILKARKKNISFFRGYVSREIKAFDKAKLVNLQHGQFEPLEVEDVSIPQKTCNIM